LLANGGLKLRDVGTTDAGDYLCEAVNGVGNGIWKSIRLVVHGKPFSYTFYYLFA